LLLPEKILNAIKKVHHDQAAALHEPIFLGNEWSYLKECLDSTYVSSVGKYVDEFEIQLSKYTNSKFVIATVNGTAALHITLILAGLKANQEVLVPTLTFIATANAVGYCNAIPHFVDVEEKTLGIDTLKLYEYLKGVTELNSGNCVNKKTGRLIKAILPVHVFGHPSDIEGLLKIARDFNLSLIEDAAESIGSFYKNKHTGTFGILGTLSFNGNKTITTGGGGAILTNDEALAKRAKHLTTTAKIKHQWAFEHDEIGYNYRMPNINAALGCAQLEKLPFILEKKRKLFGIYKKVFEGIEEVSLMSEPIGCSSNYWLQTLILQNGFENQLEKILEVTNINGFMTRPVWRLMHLLEIYKNNPKMDLTSSEKLAKKIINIPSGLNLKTINYE